VSDKPSEQVFVFRPGIFPATQAGAVRATVPTIPGVPGQPRSTLPFLRSAVAHLGAPALGGGTEVAGWPRTSLPPRYFYWYNLGTGDRLPMRPSDTGYYCTLAPTPHASGALADCNSILRTTNWYYSEFAKKKYYNVIKKENGTIAFGVLTSAGSWSPDPLALFRATSSCGSGQHSEKQRRS
jgi:hypothetical protein